MRARPLLATVAAAVPAVMLTSPPQISVADPDTDERRSTRAIASSPGKAPATWAKLSGPLFLNNGMDILRVGARLHVVWTQRDSGPSDNSVRNRVLNANAKPVTAAEPVTTGWLALTNNPRLLRDGDDIMAVFAGIRSNTPGDPYVGPAVFATSPDGESWDLQPGSLSQTTSAGNATWTDSIDGAGQPMWGMGGFGTTVIMHRGTSAASPASTPDFESGDVDAGPTSNVTFANDRGSGDVYVGWQPLNGDSADTAGLFVQKVWPRPNGPLRHAPKSSTPAGQSIAVDQPGFLSEREGGGVYAAYRIGYPTSTRIRIWEVGTTHTLDYRSKTGTVDELSLTAGPGGRLWLSWRTVGDGKLHAARTNPAVTRLGAVRTIAPPGGDGFVWSTATEGSRGPLYLVVNAQTTGSPAMYAARVLPGLSVNATPKSLGQGKVNVLVTDAGQPVRGAKVTFRGHQATTNAAGRASFAVSRAVPDGRYPVSAAKPGYAKGSARVQVT